jgi:Tol biopolymer transport system component
MNRWRTVAWIAVLTLGGLAAHAQAQVENNHQAEVLLQEARHRALVDGDLERAIELCKKIVAEHNGNRAVAAKALLQLGRCYEKLGRAEAQKAYQRLIEEYADQPETVSQARERLSKLGYATEQKPPVISTRQVWAPALDTMGTPSPDGRYLSYVNWNNKGNLALHDFKTGENRDLTNEGTWEKPSKFCDVSIWSPDSSQIAYCWIDGCVGTHLRTIGLDGSPPRVLHCDPKSGYAWPRAWSQDGKYIAAIFCNNDVVKAEEHIDKIALISVENGSMRILKTLGNRRSRFMNFSPDGRYIAYDVETEENSRIGDIHLLAVDGSQENSLVVHPANDGAPFWSPDGKQIVFMSDRSGTMALWILDVDNGKPEGNPRQIKEMGSQFGPMGLTPDGSLYYSLRKPELNVYVAELDFDACKVSSPPTKTSLSFEGTNYGQCWSPDGKRLAYASRRNFDPPVLLIRSIETGQERELSFETVRVLPSWGRTAPRWSPDGDSILATGLNKRNMPGLYLVDIETGKPTTVAEYEREKEGGAPRWPAFSKDGKCIYYIRGDQTIVMHNLETHRERDLYRTDLNIYRLSMSPDGKKLAFFEADEPIRPNVVKTMPTLGGKPSELYTLKEGNRFSWGVGLSWTPDGDHIIVGAPDAPDKPDQLWIIPTDGGEHRKLDLKARVSHFSLHPDGRRIAFTKYEPGGGEEVWVMENFLRQSTTRE